MWANISQDIEISMDLKCKPVVEIYPCLPDLVGKALDLLHLKGRMTSIGQQVINLFIKLLLDLSW